MKQLKFLFPVIALAVAVALLWPWQTQGQLEGITNLNGLHLSQSSFGTATPQLLINNDGSGRSIEVLDPDGTPVFAIDNDGGVTSANTLASDNVENLVVAAPTAIGTATPAALINNAGVSNLLEVRDAATPVFTVRQSGTIQGLVLRYGTAGQQLVTGTSQITGTATAAHGLTTVTFCLATLGEDPTAGAGDAAHVTVAVSGNVCTLKAWQDDFVTAASETNVDVHWLVIGTP